MVVKTAVDSDVFTGDVARVFSRQEGDRARDFRGFAEAGGRDAGDDLLEHVWTDRPHHLGADVARRDRVDRHALLDAFLSQRLAEAVNRSLGRGVVALASLALEAVDRGDVDDPAPTTRSHAFIDLLGHVEQAVQVGLDDRVPLLGAHLVEHGITGDAGVVDQNFNRADFRFDLLAHVGTGFKAGHVSQINGDIQTLGSAGRFPLVHGLGAEAIVVNSHGLAALLDQRLAHRRAQTTNTTRYNGNSGHCKPS